MKKGDSLLYTFFKPPILSKHSDDFNLLRMAIRNNVLSLHCNVKFIYFWYWKELLHLNVAVVMGTHNPCFGTEKNEKIVHITKTRIIQIYWKFFPPRKLVKVLCIHFSSRPIFPSIQTTSIHCGWLFEIMFSNCITLTFPLIWRLLRVPTIHVLEQKKKKKIVHIAKTLLLEQIYWTFFPHKNEIF